MADAPKSAGFLSRQITNKNHVPEMIKQIAAAKKTGKYTFQAGKMDAILNIGIGCAILFSVCNAGFGIHQLANNYGKKEGF